MTPLAESAPPPSVFRHALWTTLTALRATVVITAIPVLVLMIRDGDRSGTVLRKIVLLNYPFLAAVFLGAWIWDFWRRRRAARN